MNDAKCIHAQNTKCIFVDRRTRSRSVLGAISGQGQILPPGHTKQPSTLKSPKPYNRTTTPSNPIPRVVREGVIFPACRKNAITRGATKEAVLFEMDMRPSPLPSLPLSIASVAYVCVLRRSGRRTQCVTVKQANEACAATAAATRRTTRINKQRIHANLVA